MLLNYEQLLTRLITPFFTPFPKKTLKWGYYTFFIPPNFTPENKAVLNRDFSNAVGYCPMHNPQIYFGG
jgi:hypothetical protein